MTILTPAFEDKFSVILIILLGVTWIVALLLLGVHALRRRLGWFERRPLKGSRAKTQLRIFDLILFLFFCGLGFLVWWLFFQIEGTVIFKTGILSLALAILTIFVVFREGLAQRIKAGRKPYPDTPPSSEDTTKS